MAKSADLPLAVNNQLLTSEGDIIKRKGDYGTRMGITKEPITTSVMATTLKQVQKELER